MVRLVGGAVIVIPVTADMQDGVGKFTMVGPPCCGCCMVCGMWNE